MFLRAMYTFLISTLLFIFVCFSLLYIFQRKLVYFPEPFRTSPISMELKNVEEVQLKTKDNQTLIAWYLKAKPGKPTFLYFHGNGGALRYRADRFTLHAEEGNGLLMMSYRGYSGSTGKPSEQKNISDALLTYDWLASQGVIPKDIILYGESLGTGVSVQVAIQRQVSGIILEAPYTSLTDVGQRVYPYLPVRLLMKDRYESSKYIKDINAPLLILHGQHDFVVPVDLGKELYRLAKEPKEIALYPNGQHSDLYLHGAWEKVLEFMKSK